MLEIIIWIIILFSSASIIFRYVLGKLLRITYRNIVKKDFTLTPKISVLIPCFNEGSHIYETIKSIFWQNYPKENIEVIVINDASNDDSLTWIEKAQKDFINVKIIDNKINKGKRLGLVEATKLSKNNFIVSVDSDVILDNNALRELMSCFTEENLVAVGGKVGISNFNENWITKTQSIKYFFGYELFKSLENVSKQVLCLSGCLTAYRRKALIDIEHFLEKRQWLGLDIKYGEDRYLTHLLVLKGYNTYINLQATCLTKSPNSLSALFSQQLRWRRSNIIDWIFTLKNFKQHIKVISPLVLLYYFSIATMIISYPLLIVHSIQSGKDSLAIIIHGVILVFLAIMYRVYCYKKNISAVDNLFSYIMMAFILMVSYAIITPLALFTLDTGSWETRKGKK